MPAGRPPKPIERMRVTARDATHKADGRELAVPEYTLERRDTVPVAPDDLGDRGLTEWEKVWCAGPWLSQDQDYHLVAMVATSYDQIEAYRTAIADEGLTVMGIHGTLIAHPLIAEVRKSQQLIIKCLSMLGFSPSDRARLGLAEVKRKNQLAELMARAKKNS